MTLSAVLLSVESVTTGNCDLEADDPSDAASDVSIRLRHKACVMHHISSVPLALYHLIITRRRVSTVQRGILREIILSEVLGIHWGS